MEPVIAYINQHIQSSISAVNDKLLEIQTYTDIHEVEEQLTTIEQFQEFLKISSTTLARYCAEQRACIDEQRAHLGCATEPSAPYTYMTNLTGSLVGYAQPAKKDATQRKDKAEPAVKNTATQPTKNTAMQPTKNTAMQPTKNTAMQPTKNSTTQNNIREHRIIPYASNPIQVPYCAVVSDIKPAIHAYDNQLYICVYPGLYCRIPFPTTIDTNAAEDRQRTVRCRALTRQACNERRRFGQQPCKYAHCGDRIIKVSSAGRCLSCPTFGNPETWTTDILQMTERDARTVLMYGLSDIIAVACWAAQKKITGIWQDLDVA